MTFRELAELPLKLVLAAVLILFAGVILFNMFGWIPILLWQWVR